MGQLLLSIESAGRGQRWSLVIAKREVSSMADGVFDIGRQYRFTMIVAVPGAWSDEESVWMVAEVDGPLLKLKAGDRVKIVNTGSRHFVSAEPL